MKEAVSSLCLSNPESRKTASDTFIHLFMGELECATCIKHTHALTQQHCHCEYVYSTRLLSSDTDASRCPVLSKATPQTCKRCVSAGGWTAAAPGATAAEKLSVLCRDRAWSVCSDSVCTEAWDRRSHSMTLESLDAVAKASPSGWQATLSTHDWCPAHARGSVSLALRSAAHPAPPAAEVCQQRSMPRLLPSTS